MSKNRQGSEPGDQAAGKENRRVEGLETGTGLGGLDQGFESGKVGRRAGPGLGLSPVRQAGRLDQGLD